MRRNISIAACLAAYLSTTNVFAQNFGSQGDAAFSAERLFGINFSHVYEEDYTDNNQADTGGEDSFTGISLGWRGVAGGSVATSNPLDAPRVAFDYFVIDKLSVGGSLGYVSVSEDDDGNEGFGIDQYSALLFNPRVGYALMFSEAIGFWPQGGFTYYSVSLQDIYSASGLALTFNLPFVFSPANHFAIQAGPYVDLGITGTIEDETNNPAPDHDLRYRSIGLQIGLMGWI